MILKTLINTMPLKALQKKTQQLDIYKTRAYLDVYTEMESTK